MTTNLRLLSLDHSATQSGEMMADHNETTTYKTYHHGFYNTNDADRVHLNPEPPSYSFDEQNTTTICSSLQPPRSDRPKVSRAPHSPYQDKVLLETQEGYVNPPQQIVAFDRVAIQRPLNGSQDVRSHFPLSVIVALCCCLPIGVCAICFSQQAKASLARGNYREAKRYSKRALYLSICGIVLGIIFAGILFYIIYFKE
ncbi:unnamed protein product [Lymnaea stagnalis]|uniref:Uncharacterized protein n=1 Tax=Lymnaea stagnalis TaxID=6523 RepID=A0AAV2H7B9_LYMST